MENEANGIIWRQTDDDKYRSWECGRSEAEKH